MTDEVLFCPFCGEAFEGQTACPAHELTLVPWGKLPQPEREAHDAEPLAWPSLRLGRGNVAFGAGLALLAFSALPLASVSGPLQMGGSMLVLALGGAHKLWLVPAAAWAQLAILYRRRSPAAMRGARLAVALVACVPVLAAAWTWIGTEQAIGLLSERTQQQLVLRPASGAYALLLAVATMLSGAVRLGAVARRSRRLIKSV